MNFDRIQTAPCIVPETAPPDSRCSVSEFAISHPDTCGNGPVIILKPAVIMLCALESIQFKAFSYADGVEQELTGVQFTSSDPAIFSVGVNSGSGTALGAGNAVITASKDGKTASATVQVRPGTNCCDTARVVSAIVIDNSYSGTLNFGGAYATRLVFAKAIATLYGSGIKEVDGEPKDGMRVWSLNSTLTSILDEFTGDTEEIADAIADITQSPNKTDLLPAFVEVVAALLAEESDRRILFLVSDGEHSVNTDRQSILDAAATFKQAGGVVIVVGLRASGVGYDLLERVATGGFFFNALPNAIDEAMEAVAYLKSLVCAGECVPPGDEYVNAPELNYSSFGEFEVTDGLVNLLGPGLLDLQPGNGLYVEMNGGVPATIRTIDSFPLIDGHTYLIKFRAAGNQREEFAGEALKVFLREAGAAESDPNVFEAVAIKTWNQEFQQHSFAFTATYDATVKLYFQQLYSGSAPVIGSLLDAIEIIDQTNLETIFAEDFDEENIQYVTPDCGPSGARDEVTNPDAPETTVLRDSGDALADMEFYRYAASYVTHEGETAATVQLIGFPSIGTDNGIVSVRLPAIPSNFADRIVRVRLWRNLGDTTDPNTGDLYLLTELGPDQSHYLDYERIADFQARYDNSVVAPETNTTGVAGGQLGYGYAYCCYYSFTTAESATPNADLIPEMTSDTEPSGEASSFGDVSSGVAFQALDQDTGTNCQLEGNVAQSGDYNVYDDPPWIQYRFPTAKIARTYSITPHVLVSGIGSPEDFTFEGSNDGSTWTVLDTQAGVMGWVGSVAQTFTISSPEAFTHYRVKISKVSSLGAISASKVVYVEELQIYGNEESETVSATFTNSCQPCATSTPGAQLPDPNPLPDIETGYVPPVSYSSTQTRCAACLAGFSNLALQDYSATPTGELLVGRISINADGNNDGNNDFQLFALEYTRDGSTWHRLVFDDALQTSAPMSYDLPLPVYALAFRVFNRDGNSEVLSSATVTITGIYTEVAAPCASATETSTISQLDADQKAAAAALESAQALLNCYRRYTATIPYTATCPAGSLGSSVTRSATAHSYISQQEADAVALATAQALAEAELDCTASNNNQRLDINDGGTPPTKATPYPGVKYVSGVSGAITKVTLQLKRFNHGNYADVVMLLVSPAGTAVYVLGNTMDAPFDTIERNITLDDDAASSVPEFSRPAGVDHTYKPTAYGGQIAPFPAPAPAADPGPTYPTTLAEFIGENPNGSWALYVVDDTALDSGYLLTGWDLTITTA